MTDANTKPRKRGGLTTLFFLLFGMAIALTLLPFGPGFRIFRMPSGSMQPTLHVGDNFVVAKWTYGYGRYSFAPFPGPEARIFGRAPERGELVVFRPTQEPDRDFIKRVIGLPGDRIQMIDGLLHINGVAVERESLGAVNFTDESGFSEDITAWRETLPNGVSFTTFDRDPTGELDNTREYLVPEGNYFLMGDDRDNSADSRVPSVTGYVPLGNFIGPVVWVMSSRGE